MVWVTGTESTNRSFYEPLLSCIPATTGIFCVCRASLLKQMWNWHCQFFYLIVHCQPEPFEIKSYLNPDTRTVLHVSVINHDPQGDIIQKHMKLTHPIYIHNFIRTVCICCCIWMITVMLHVTNNIKLINAPQEQTICKYKNTKDNHLKTKDTIWFNNIITLYL